MFMSSISLLTSIVVLGIHHQNNSSPPPMWLRKFVLHYMGRIFSVNHKTTWHVYHNIKSNLFEKAFAKQKNMNNKKNNEELNEAGPSKFASIFSAPTKPPLRKMKSRAELKTGEGIKKVGLFDIVSQYVLTQNAQRHKKETNNSVEDVTENDETDERVKNRKLISKKFSTKIENHFVEKELNNEKNQFEQKLNVAEMQAMLMEAEKLESQSSRLINQLLWYKVCHTSFFYILFYN